MRRTTQSIVSWVIALLMLAALPPAASLAAGEEPTVLLYHRVGQELLDPNNQTFQRLRQAALEQANVDIQLNVYNWGDTYNQKMSMFAASGGMPAGVWTMGGVMDASATELIDNLGMYGMIFDWTEVVNDTENYPNLLGNAEEQFVKMAVTKDDGGLYGLPAERHGSYPHAPGGVSIRKDWMEEAGLSYPTTEDELYDLIVTYKNTFRNDAGAEIIPVSFSGFANLNYWLNSWLGTSMWFQKEDGSYAHGLYDQMDRLTAAALFLNRLWNEGLLDKESFSQKDEQYVEKGSNGSFGVTSFTYGGTYTINDALYASAPDTNKYIVSIPSASFYPELDAADVHSMELTSVPFNRTVVSTTDTDYETFKKVAKAIDWIGGYDASLMFLMGFEGAEWEYEEGTNRKIRTAPWTENVQRNNDWQYVSGLCYWSSLNSNVQAMYDLLAAICVRKSDVDSVTNIKGHQAAVYDAMNIVSQGPLESSYSQLLADAFQQMFISAVSAPNAGEAERILQGWPSTRDGLGYRDIIQEREASIAELGL